MRVLRGVYQTISFRYKEFNLKENGWLHNDIANRGVENLKNYHYYEDGKLIFDAIHDYLSNCVNTIYGKLLMIINKA